MGIVMNTVLIVQRKFTKKFYLLSIAAIIILYWKLYLRFSTPLQTNCTESLDLKRLVESLNLSINTSDKKNLSFKIANANTAKYVVKSRKCHIPDLDPPKGRILPIVRPKRYIACTTTGLLTYVKKVNNTATLYINESLVKKYTNDSIDCRYRFVERNSGVHGIGNIDNYISFSEWIEFEHNATLTEDTVHVECSKNTTKIYQNIHTVVKIKDAVRKKMEKYNTLYTNEQLSILVIGIDGVSRMSLMRSLPQTHAFLKKHNWAGFKGYHKVGDNSFSNMMAILAGLDETSALELCNPRNIGALDQCSMIWYDYRKLGFVTAYGEDATTINAFSSSEGGFYKEPTDYYFRPYLRATEITLPYKKVNNLKYCTGPETAGERIMNLAKDFTTTFQNYPTFSVFWMNSYSRNEINTVSIMDAKIATFLEDLHKSGIFQNSLTFFVSNRGYNRFSPVIHTRAELFDDKLPFFYMSVPQWFKEKYPSKYKNLIKNTERLISPFDVYMTLQNVLFLYRRNYRVRTSYGCPLCKSLFKSTKYHRSCDDAGIQTQWCGCLHYVNFNKSHLLTKKAAEFMIEDIHKIMVINMGDNYRKCVDFKLRNIIKADFALSFLRNRIVYLFLITFETRPLATFQGIVSIDIRMPSFKVEGSVNRLDRSSKHGWCVEDKILKAYCYCRNKFSEVTTDGIDNRFSMTSFVYEYNPIFVYL
ncbi:hypothetical protein ILUMI_22206 [Ignelater luminosus]|uniref:Uncharacterized protein n=1 Tax=Ignelater luminosus TaxID=2038154 RepID=A0A8K0G349_IGNLU|nr:hypothetical protein ILUMI_22206 [Ignelater luminosus]